MSFGRAIALIGGWTMLSRLLGFARDVAIAALAGAGPVADAFFIALKLPNLFRRLFAEGAFASAFVPLFARARREGGDAEAAAFAREAQGALLAVLAPFVVAGIAAMAWIVPLVAPGLASKPPETLSFAIEFSRIAFPYLLFISLASLYAGILNSLDRYGHAAASQVLFNLSLIGALFALTPFLPNAGYALSWGLCLAGVAQWLWLLVACRQAGVALPLAFPRLTARVRRLLTLALPAAVGAGVQQINLVLEIVWASLLPTGAISVLYYADRINQLPLGVVGVAIGTALLPRLARLIRDDQAAGAMHSQNRAVEFGLLFSLPAAVALAVVAWPVIATLFLRGQFTAEDARRTAEALTVFALGLPAFILTKTLAPGFFAREDTATPLKIAVFCISLNIALNLLFITLPERGLMPRLEHVGVALASSVAGWFNAVLMWLVLRRRGHFHVDARLAARGPRIALAAALMGATLWAAMAWTPLGGAFDAGGAGRWLALLILCGGGGAAFVAFGAALGVIRPVEIRGLLRRDRTLPPDPRDTTPLE
ncbi:MAG: murein biosynthesis integral membrane protein MurJ [Rhodospirillales bacterium]|nr:MAG: murein biosynthesis integral membrane protein MurJ [Rhodospirillales bacterium]